MPFYPIPAPPHARSLIHYCPCAIICVLCAICICGTLRCTRRVRTLLSNTRTRVKFQNERRRAQQQQQQQQHHRSLEAAWPASRLFTAYRYGRKMERAVRVKCTVLVLQSAEQRESGMRVLKYCCWLQLERNCSSDIVLSYCICLFAGTVSASGCLYRCLVMEHGSVNWVAAA